MNHMAGKEMFNISVSRRDTNIGCSVIFFFKKSQLSFNSLLEQVTHISCGSIQLGEGGSVARNQMGR